VRPHQWSPRLKSSGNLALLSRRGRAKGLPRRGQQTLEVLARTRTGVAKGSDETAAHRDGGGLGAGVDPELGEEIGNVGLHGAGADEKRLTNLFVG
jgi:hypothetical protein